MKKDLIKFIINVDDLGLNKGVNQAVSNIAEKGFFFSASLMSNMPCAEEARELRRKFPNLGIGIHFTLTEGSPITPAKSVGSLVDAQGQFLDSKVMVGRMKAKKIRLSEVRVELEAQIKRAREIVGTLDHWDSHHGIHIQPYIFSSIIQIVKRSGIFNMRTPPRKWLEPVGTDSCRPVSSSFWLARPMVAAKNVYRIWLSSRLKKQSFKMAEYMLTLSKRSINEVDMRRFIGGNLKPGVYEIPCHPVTETFELSDQEFAGRRLPEYEWLMSNEFIDYLTDKNIMFTNFTKEFHH